MKQYCNITIQYNKEQHNIVTYKTNIIILQNDITRPKTELQHIKYNMII